MRRRVGPVCLVFALLATALAAQEEVYLKVTSPGLQRVVIGVAPFASRSAVDAVAASQFMNTLRADLDQTAVMGLLPEANARLVEPAPGDPGLTRQRWRSVGAHRNYGSCLANSGFRPGCPPRRSRARASSISDDTTRASASRPTIRWTSGQTNAGISMISLW